MGRHICYLTGGQLRDLLRRFGRTDPIMINLVSVLEALDQLGDGVNICCCQPFPSCSLMATA